MKNKNYIVKGTPIVPSLCGIAMAVLWYMSFVFTNGEWHFQMNPLSFSEMTGADLYFTVLSLLIPVIFFIGALFLAEIDLRWMILVLLIPIVNQISVFVSYSIVYGVQYMFDYPLLTAPVQFVAPFLALILFALTIEKVIPTKWVFVGFCGVAILLPLILTLCGVGDFFYFDPTVSYTPIATAYLWSDYLSFALYYLGLGALALQMRPPKESDFVTLAEMKQAYDEKMAAQNSEEDSSEDDTTEEQI